MDQRNLVGANIYAKRAENGYVKRSIALSKSFSSWLIVNIREIY